MERGLEHATVRAAHRRHHFRRGILRRGNGLVARSAAGALRCDQISAHYPAHDDGQRAHQCHARAAARPEHSVPPILLRDCDELHHRGGDSWRVQPIDCIHGLERAADVVAGCFNPGLQFDQTDARRRHHLRRCDGQRTFAPTARAPWRQPGRRVSRAVRVAGGKSFSRQSALVDSATVHRRAVAAGGIYPHGRVARKFLRKCFPLAATNFPIRLSQQHHCIMNDQNPVPPLTPPQIPPVIDSSGPRQLGDDPAERVVIPHAFAAIEALLRQPRRLLFQMRRPGAGKLIAAMLFTAFLCSLIYGVVAGTFSGGTQLWAAPVKIAAGLMISAGICLPSLYIFTCLSGSQARLIEVGGLLAGLLMLMTILLIGFAPVAWIFSQSTESLAWMGTLHLIFWFIATIFGLRFLETGFSHSNAKSLAGFRTWVVIFLLVAIQMTTALRPILGTSETFLPTEKKFFVAHWGDCLNGQDGASKSGSR